MFDDRLATVLRMRAQSAAGERTQFRQLLDLLGTNPGSLNGRTIARLARGFASLPAQERVRMLTAQPGSPAKPKIDRFRAYLKLEMLMQSLAPQDQSRILREPGLRIRNTEMVAFLADRDPRIAASAMATARLSEAEWEDVLPDLPVIARGFLRHRRDLPPRAVRMLQQLGVGDLTLSDARPVERVQPAPEPREAPPLDLAENQQMPEAEPVEAMPIAPPIEVEQPVATDPAAKAAPTPPPPGPAKIGDLLERIEQYRHGRRLPVLAPRLPLGDAPVEDAPAKVLAFDVRTDADGRALAASEPVAPWITGMLLAAPRPGPLVRYDAATATAIRHFQPLHGERVTLEGPAQIAGEWLLDAVPVFTRPRGSFDGYRCRLRRPLRPEAPTPPAESHAERMRQLLHELRTPVGAIQGFAEIIQQQMFGPAPHEYRAHAAAIAVDAARLLAGFDEMERLARLESGAARLEAGEGDFRAVLENTVNRLAAVLRARKSGFDLVVEGKHFAVALADGEALALAWRVLASIAGALAPGRQVPLLLASDGSTITLRCELPPSLLEEAEPPNPPQRRAAVSAGMFGPHFAFRLARAEAQAAGGDLETMDGKLALSLPVLAGPVLTRAAQPNSSDGEQAQG